MRWKKRWKIKYFNTFKAIKRGVKSTKGYQIIPVKIVFDVKFDLGRKYMMLPGVQITEDTNEYFFSVVVFLDVVGTELFLSKINYIYILAEDVGSAYLHGYTKEKIYTISGPEFSEKPKGKIFIIVRVLCGLKTIMAIWYGDLSDKLNIITFKPHKPDPDLCIREIGNQYEYVDVYSDDLLVFSKNPVVFSRSKYSVSTQRFWQYWVLSQR